MPTLASLARAIDPRRLFLRDAGPTWHRLDWGAAAGMPRATPQGALSIAAAWACQHAIATDLAALPLVVMQKLDGGRRRVASDHEASEILGLSPDGVRTAIDFRQAMQGHALGWGNGVAEILRDRATGELKGLRLEPAGSAAAYVRTSDGGIGYRLASGRRVRAEDVLHVAGFGPDGLCGYTPIEVHRQTIELGLASAVAGNAWYRNGGMPSGWIKTAKRMDKEATERFLSQFEKRHASPANAGRIGILDEGKEFIAASINPRDAQYLELRQFTVLEICRIYRCPPHKICDFSQVQLASSATEAANIAYVGETLLPWAMKWEQQIALKIFTATERRAGFYVKHNFMALLRGDIRTRAEYYRLAVSNGWMTRDEVRALEDMDPIGPEMGGDKFTVQGQMIDLAAVGSTPASTTNPNPSTTD
jgi:HK97 family phage portal protein